ncbi:MAG: PQQ-binding-like beta-propeller repeat protein, partial [Candidatus Aminicenantes bacterium]
MLSKLGRCVLALFILFGSISGVQGKKEEKGVNWPSFRGPYARGIGENYSTPLTWDVDASKNIKWKTPIPGLAHSSPVIWENRVFVTTALSEKDNPELKIGLYGGIQPVDDDSVHQWKVYCLDKKTGKILWEKTAHKGVPQVKRHPKATHANSSPATDGKHVVAFFGSEGLYCYDMNGELIWKKDFGLLDSAFFSVPSAQWGFASSPVIHEGVVVVQCDALNTAFLAALDIKTGKEIWRTPREDFPTWSTPTIHVGDKRTQIIVNGFKHIGSYDFKTGKELWKISGGGDIPVPTPVVAHDLVFINGAHGRLSPIYAIKLDSKGDISLTDGKTSNESVVWSVSRGGAYMQTPLIYGDYLYNLQSNGLLSCFRAQTGELIYREQLGKRTGFSASGIASDGKLYFSSEEGDIFVVKAGPDFEVLATNSMKDECMATPAISEGTLYFRTHHYLVAVS